jgi:hypothetical protein
LSKDIFIMAKLTQKTLMPNAAALADLIHLVDVSDTSQSPSGSSYRFSLSQLRAFLTLVGNTTWTNLDPTVNDDSTQGYVIGAMWWNEDSSKLFICNDVSVGAAEWVLASSDTLQSAYNNGNVVNGNTITFSFTAGPNLYKIGIGFESLLNATGDNLIGLGFSALKNSTGSNVIALGSDAANLNTGVFVCAIGDNSAALNEGDFVNAMGVSSALSNEGYFVNAIGRQAGIKNTANDSNFFGQNAGYDSGLQTGNTTAFGVTVFSPESVPSYADHTAALAGLTVANGCVAGQVYIYRNVATNAIGFVLPV